MVPVTPKLVVIFPPPVIARGELTVAEAEVEEAVPTPIPFTALIATV